MTRVRLLRLVVALCALWFALPAWAARVQISIDSHTLQVGQVGQVSVVVLGGDELTRPNLLVPDGFEARYLRDRPQIEVIGGQVTTRYWFYFAVKAPHEGEFDIGPATVIVDGVDLTTGVVPIEVVPAEALPDEPLTAEAHFLVDHAWEGQVVLYEYVVRSRVQLKRVRWTQMPIDGLARPRDGSPVRNEFVIEHPEGAVLVDRTRDPLLITAADDLELPPAVARVEIPSTRSRSRSRPYLTPTETRTLATESITLPVSPLPPAPDGFTGLVGDFVFTSELEAQDVAVGESVDWTIRVRGDGSLEGFSLPPPEGIDGARFYEGTPLAVGGVTGETYVSEGSFAHVVVPTATGSLVVPPLDLIVFSPRRGEYVTHRVEGALLSVVAGTDGSGTLESFSPDAPVLEPDAPPIVDVHPVYASGPARVVYLPPLLLVGLVIGLILLAAPWVIDLVRWARARRAARLAGKPVQVTPLQLLAQLPSEPGQRLVVLDLALRDALARYLDLPGGRVERGAAIEQLPEGLAGRTRTIAAALDRARFAGDEVMMGLDERVREIVRDLEAR